MPMKSFLSKLLFQRSIFFKQYSLCSLVCLNLMYAPTGLPFVNVHEAKTPLPLFSVIKMTDKTKCWNCWYNLMFLFQRSFGTFAKLVFDFNFYNKRTRLSEGIFKIGTPIMKLFVSFGFGKG